MATSSETCAQEVLEVVPVVMRTIRGEMRQQRAADLSVPQFRTLNFIDRNAEASLSDVADHIGLTLPSMSKIVDGLVARKLVMRETRPDDRRRMTLALTTSGQTALESSRKSTRACLANALASLPDADRTNIVKAMAMLRSVFSPHQASSAKNVR
jgi:DNA-binding MarR family transcriptional regulator